MKFIAWVSSVVCISFLVGCAHRIDVKPDVADISKAQSVTKKVDAVVGYYIPDNLLKLEVTTPGGGGDNVRYKPYADIESGYKLVLSQIYKDVQKVSANTSFDKTNQNFDYIFEPVIITSSGSTAFFTWPPTNFSIDLTSNIRDRSGTLVASPRVVGIGTASTSERIRTHGIAGKRAMADVLVKFQDQLQEINRSSDNNNPTVTFTGSVRQEDKPSSSIEKRLQDLESLKAKGLIDENEYRDVRQKILKGI